MEGRAHICLKCDWRPTVHINWVEVEKQAKGNDSYLAPLSKLMLSIRDRTYKDH